VDTFLTYTFIGLGLGSVYGIFGLSFGGIYTSTGIVNFAQGDFAMLGGMISSVAVYHWGLPYVLGCLISMAGAGVLAVIIQFGIVEPLLRRNAGIIAIIIGTVAIGLMLEGAIGATVGYATQPTANYISPNAYHLGNIVLAKIYLVIIIATVVVTAAYWLFTHKTIWGKALLATGNDSIGAQAVGIPARRVRTWAFVLSAAIAAIAGFLVAPLVSVSVTEGYSLLMYGFIAAVIGGVDRPYAALPGGIILGLLTSYMAGWNGDFVAFAQVGGLILILAIRPKGLFGVVSP
jgi:branched-chain amino acid transport system permease protein